MNTWDEGPGKTAERGERSYISRGGWGAAVTWGAGLDVGISVLRLSSSVVRDPRGSPEYPPR